MLHPEEDWGGHGFPLPFLAGTCALVSLLRKQLKYISENIFWPCWNCYHKIQILRGNYCTADSATELSAG